MPGRRKGATPKRICLTEEGIAVVQRYAEANCTSFSAAIETLARLGAGEPAATAMVPMLVSVVRRAVLNQMNRFAKLAATAAIQSGMATNLVGAALRIALQDRAQAHPKDFEDTIFEIATDDPAEAVYREIRRDARLRIVRSLREPLEELTAPPEEVPDGSTKE